MRPVRQTDQSHSQSLRLKPRIFPRMFLLPCSEDLLLSGEHCHNCDSGTGKCKYHLKSFSGPYSSRQSLPKLPPRKHRQNRSIHRCSNHMHHIPLISMKKCWSFRQGLHQLPLRSRSHHSNPNRYSGPGRSMSDDPHGVFSGNLYSFPEIPAVSDTVQNQYLSKHWSET